ncbi:hypothetical protein L1987_52482 [Smallanthus sonchifolius]|uniref:Uncharacterized protein n=1 Tax=Smallanthus sonchifolius TaxID=185202 RepID=A0ACB9ESX2_9ASTR|nr:hypothetical protein L1987_52482 [Smallanthus sonchifolius]
MVNQLNQNVAPRNPACTFKHFNSCNPTKFYGNEGATGLLQWFESIEGTFINADCPENLKVRYATSVFQKRALTWWNGEKRNRGIEVALALPWADVKALMTDEFCPRNEVKKLEAEFWDLKQDSGESLAYTTRFHELSLLVPHMVTPLSRAIEKYINGLPMQIQDTVLGSNPATLEEAIRLAATLSDNHVKAGTLSKKGAKKTFEKATTEPLKETKSESSFNNMKRKGKNFAIITPATPLAQVAPTAFNPTKKQYAGSSPLCNTCKLHHPAHAQCRLCTTCGRYGHWANTCRIPPTNQVYQPAALVPAPAAIAQGRACYECGDPNHFRNRCPSLVIVNQANLNQGNMVQGKINQGNMNRGNVNQGNANPVARGRAFNINANEAQANNDVVNGTYPINHQYASILFDTGSDRSFVSFEFEPQLAMGRAKLDKPFDILVADGYSVSCDTIIRDCTLTLSDHDFSINLIPMALGGFDIIVGMDWLTKHHAEVVCFDKYICIPLDSADILNVYGEKPSKGLKLMSCTTAQKYLRKKCVAFLAHILERKVKDKNLQDIPVIKDFPEVFPEDLPGLPPIRQVEFRIDLVPGANPVAKIYSS